MPAGRPGLAAIADVLDGCRATILARWRDRVRQDASLHNTSEWTRKQFYDHFPDVLDAFSRTLRAHPEAGENAGSDAFVHAHAHAKTRWLQGYALRDLVREWGHFNTSVVIEFARVRQGGAADAVAFGVAETIWSDLASQQLTAAAQEYQRLHQAEAATRAEELAALLARLESLQQARARTLGRTAATLRSELSTLLTTNALMADGPTGDDAAELHALARDSIASFERSLGDLLLLARLEAGLERRAIAPFDVGQTLPALALALEPQARQCRSQITWSGPDEFPVEGDEHAVRRIAQHLLLTGLRASSAGPVDLEWGEDPREPARWRLVVRQHLLPRAMPSSPAISRVLADASESAGHARGSAPTGFEAALHDGLIPVAAENGADVLIAKHLCELLDAGIELTAEEGVVTFRLSFPRHYDMSAAAAGRASADA